MNRCESDTRPASCVSSRYRSQNQSAMPLDDLQQYGRNSSSSSDSGQSDDDANCSKHKADGNATDSESGEDGDEAQQSDEQSENGGYDSSQHTPAQKSKRAPFTQHSADHLPDLVHESDDEDCAEASDEETLAARYTIPSQIKRPRVEWEHVTSWSRHQVSKDDYEGEIARIMAKSLSDARHVVTPKYNPRAISDFRFKTVSPIRFLLFSFVSCSVIFC